MKLEDDPSEKEYDDLDSELDLNSDQEDSDDETNNDEDGDHEDDENR